ncbi:hypothetical protein SADUNF_Sadunf15G0104000 [Salix dunnii]|uniref:Uncharacterized protein n=1 Tax=Salix dunnii TaxID=1413687 RepID=A0A835MJK8_9ROSI|nr:hypothetical protein SADUNF_Sadunf15G0104000 [Salix dunnii]
MQGKVERTVKRSCKKRLRNKIHLSSIDAVVAITIFTWLSTVSSFGYNNPNEAEDALQKAKQAEITRKLRH